MNITNHYNVILETTKEVPNKVERFTNFVSMKKQSIVHLADYESAIDMIAIMTRDVDLKDQDEIVIKIVRI